MSELRKDLVIDRWVIIAAERGDRPHDIEPATQPDPTEPCPFCAGHEALTPPEVFAYRDTSTAPNMPGWRIRVVPNKYPALASAADFSRQTDGMYEFMDGLGVHEVIIETPRHCANMAELSERQFEDALRAYRQRMVDVQKDPRWQSILIYKNQGSAAGATLEHVHSQLLAMPMVPREVAEEWRAAKAHYMAKRKCLYCGIIESERADRRRIVAENDAFIVFCPFAPRFPFETWLLPKRHSPYFHTVTEDELRQFAGLLRQSLRRLDRAAAAPFNYVIHCGPLKESGHEHFHWRLEILPRISKIAGFELSSGYYINTVAPEAAARDLRDALP